jgi:hypothetical protein
VCVCVCVCVCCLPIMQSACVVLYCQLWPLCCAIFFHVGLFVNGTIFENKIIEHKMCVLILSTTFV